MAKGKAKFKRIAQNFIFHFDTAFWQTEGVFLRDFLCPSPTPVTQHSPPVAASPTPSKVKRVFFRPPIALSLSMFSSPSLAYSPNAWESHTASSPARPLPSNCGRCAAGPLTLKSLKTELSQALDTAAAYSRAAARQDASPGGSLVELETLNSPINLSASLNPTSLE